MVSRQTCINITLYKACPATVDVRDRQTQICLQHSLCERTPLGKTTDIHQFSLTRPTLSQCLYVGQGVGRLIWPSHWRASLSHGACCRVNPHPSYEMPHASLHLITTCITLCITTCVTSFTRPALPCYRCFAKAMELSPRNPYIYLVSTIFPPALPLKTVCSWKSGCDYIQGALLG